MTMVLFRIGEASFDCLTSPSIRFLSVGRKPHFVGSLYGIGIDMPSDYLLHVFALGTVLPLWAEPALIRVGVILSVSVS